MFTQLIVPLTLALYCAASPAVVRENLVKLPIARRFNATGTSKLVELDRARAAALKSSVGTNRRSGKFKSALRAAIGNEPVTNQATIYTAAVCLMLLSSFDSANVVRCSTRSKLAALPRLVS